jgi:CRISPR-associated endonuclease Cas2
MFLILVYDVNEKRVNKVLKTCRKYLHWVQNSVLEGEISEAKKRIQLFFIFCGLPNILKEKSLGLEKVEKI